MKYGAYMSRLQHAADNLSNTAVNTSFDQQIADADYAAETSELARTRNVAQRHRDACSGESSQADRSVALTIIVRDDVQPKRF